MNRFGYIEARDRPQFTDSVVAVEGQALAVTVVQPTVPVTRGQKTIAADKAAMIMEQANLGQPAPPTRPPVRWSQTRAQSPLALEVSYSRTDLLSQQVANG